MLTANAPDHFAADLRKLDEVLSGYLIEFEDGFIGVDPSAPTSLTRPYKALQQMGYANGWIA